jgi:uncharacterized protein YciI
MAADLPEGLAIEGIWVVEASYGPDVAERRPPVRAEHLTRIAALLVRAASEEAALALARSDVYFRSEVWAKLRARAFGRVVPLDELATD